MSSSDDMAAFRSPEMTADLVTRLRAWADTGEDDENAPLMAREAAEALGEYAATNESRWQGLHESIDSRDRMVAELLKQRKALTAERDQLKMRLRPLGGDCGLTNCGKCWACLNARLAAAERVVKAARAAAPFLPDICAHAGVLQPHPDGIWCGARHRHAIVDALRAYEKAYSGEPSTTVVGPQPTPVGDVGGGSEPPHARWSDVKARRGASADAQVTPAVTSATETAEVKFGTEGPDVPNLMSATYGAKTATPDLNFSDHKEDK